MNTRPASRVGAFTATLPGCGSTSEKFAGDPILQKPAKEAYESAKGMPNLGVNFNWQHSLSGDFSPSFQDEGTFEWGYRGQPQKTLKFTCTGRFDAAHGNL